MTKRVLFAAAIALISAVSTATSVGADPSLYSVLSCDCDGTTTSLDRGPTGREQIDAGIENGLADILGNGG